MFSWTDAESASNSSKLINLKLSRFLWQIPFYKPFMFVDNTFLQQTEIYNKIMSAIENSN